MLMWSSKSWSGSTASGSSKSSLFNLERDPSSHCTEEAGDEAPWEGEDRAVRAGLGAAVGAADELSEEGTLG